MADMARFAGRLWIVSVLVPCSLSAREYSLPLGNEAPLTSTFGEYRTRHFHGGIDLSTEGETGREVYAAGSGYVWRLRVSGSGYGKAVYLRLDDGRTAVYAHLKEFCPRIQSAAEGLQRQNESYRIDHIFTDQELRVEAGDLIAYSGDTGAGPAHLHFELRNGEIQLNPLTHGVRARDTLPPRIRSVILIPIGSGSSVDNMEEPLAVGLRWNRKRSVYGTGRVPLVRGNIGIACRVYDLADGKPNRLAPYRLQLRVDGETAYDVRFDTVPLLSSHHVELVYSYSHAMRGSRDVMNLFCAPGTRAGVALDESPWEGVLRVVGGGGVGSISLAVGPHDIEVQAWDVYGNHRSAVLSVVADNGPVIRSAELDSSGGRIDLNAFDPDGDQLTLSVDTSVDGGRTWSERLSARADSSYSGSLEVPSLGREEIIRVRAADKWGALSPAVYLGPGLSVINEGPPKMTVRLRDGHAETVCMLSAPSAGAPALWLVDPDGSVPIRSLRADRLSPESFRTLIPLDGSLGRRAAVMASTAGPKGPQSTRVELDVTGVKCGEHADVELPGGAVLAVSEGAFLNDTFFKTVVGDSAEFGWEGELTPMSKVFEFTPMEQFFDKPVSLFLPLDRVPEKVERVGLYRSAGRGGWSWVGGTRREQDTLIGGTISHLSEFILMEDLEPPRVVRLRPRAGQRLRGPRPFLEARVRDGGSGLDWDRVYFRIDGEKLITAWEAERSHAWVRVPHNLSPGPHEVEFFAADRAGNETVHTVPIVVTR